MTKEEEGKIPFNGEWIPSSLKATLLLGFLPNLNTNAQWFPAQVNALKG